MFISLATPKTADPEWLKRIMLGAKTIAGEFGCGIDGGDTNSWDGPFAINVCVTGKPHWRGPIRRNQARVGDAIMVTGGSLGGSLKTGRHASFTPRLREVRWILDQYPIHSMIDISDGVATEARLIAQLSQKKLIIESAALCPQSNADSDLRSALCDGEDFELFFTCSQDTAAKLEREFPWPCGVRKIGSVEEGDGVFLRLSRQENPVPLEFSGYEH